MRPVLTAFPRLTMPFQATLPTQLFLEDLPRGGRSTKYLPVSLGLCSSSTGSSLSNRYWAEQTNKLGQSTQVSSVAGLLLRVETNTVCGFPYLELLLNEVSGSFQYTVSVDIPVQLEEQGFSTLLMTILAASI